MFKYLWVQKKLSLKLFMFIWIVAYIVLYACGIWSGDLQNWKSPEGLIIWILIGVLILIICLLAYPVIFGFVIYPIAKIIKLICMYENYKSLNSCVDDLKENGVYSEDKLLKYVVSKIKYTVLGFDNTLCLSQQDTFKIADDYLEINPYSRKDRNEISEMLKSISGESEAGIFIIIACKFLSIVG